MKLRWEAMGGTPGLCVRGPLTYFGWQLWPSCALPFLSLPLSQCSTPCSEPEWEVKEILDSCWHWRKFQFLIKWKGFSREHNSWEVASDVKALDLIAEYYQKYPAAPRYIHWMDFDALFKSGTIASRRSNLGGGVNVRGPLTHDSGAHISPLEWPCSWSNIAI